MDLRKTDLILFGQTILTKTPALHIGVGQTQKWCRLISNK